MITREHNQLKEEFMISWALTFFILAILSAILGFTGIAGTFAWGAQVLFIAFIILFIISAILGRNAPPV